MEAKIKFHLTGKDARNLASILGGATEAVQKEQVASKPSVTKIPKRKMPKGGFHS